MLITDSKLLSAVVISVEGEVWADKSGYSYDGLTLRLTDGTELRLHPEADEIHVGVTIEEG